MKVHTVLNAYFASIAVLAIVYAESGSRPAPSEVFDRAPAPPPIEAVGPGAGENQPREIAAAAAKDGPLAGSWEKRASFLRGRIYHSAVWTYAEMIVWGGGPEHQFYDDGGTYDPAKDTWRAISQINAPADRRGR